MKKLRCFLDGNRLCVVADDFVDLQESDAVFIELFTHNIGEIQKYKRGKYRIIMIKYNEYLNYFKESMDYLLNDEDLEILNELRTKIVKKENNDDVALKLREQNMELVKRLIEVENEKLDLVMFISKLIVELTELRQVQTKHEDIVERLTEITNYLLDENKKLKQENEKLVENLNELRDHRQTCMDLTDRLIEINQRLIDKIEYIKNNEEPEPDDIEEYIDFHINKMRAEGGEPKYLIVHEKYLSHIRYILNEKFNHHKFTTVGGDLRKFKGLKIIETDKDILMIV